MYMSICLHMCYVHYAHVWCPWKTEGTEYVGTGVTNSCKQLHGYWDLL